MDALRSAVRGLLRAPGLTAVLVASLALGAGANAMLFGMARGLLFSVPAVADPSSLVSIYTSQFSGAPFGLSSHPDFESIARAPGPVDAIAASDESRFRAVTIDDRVRDVRVAAVSGAFFPVLGLQPPIGRLLSPDDDPAANVAVVSHTAWMELGGDDSVLGRTLSIGAREFEIVGVTPRDFIGLSLQRECEIWIPLDPAAAGGDRGLRRLTLIARLNPGATVAEADTHVAGIGAGLADEFPATNRGTRDAPGDPRRLTAIRYSRLEPAFAAQVTAIGAVIVGAAIVLLAGACINAGGLLLSRAVGRRQQFAVQVLLGATRARLIRIVLAECALIALGSAALGLVLAGWTASALPPMFAPEHARFLDTRLDAVAVLTTLAVASLAAVLFSVGPALHAAKAQALSAVRQDAGGVSATHGGARIRGALVIAQVALSTMLVAASGVLWATMAASLGTGFGVNPARITVATVQLTDVEHHEDDGRARQDAVERAIRSVAGVDALAWTTTLPIRHENRRQYAIRSDTRTRLGPADLSPSHAGQASDAIEPEISLVSRNYFEVMGIALIEGRLFNAIDESHRAPVVVVSEAFAREYFRDSAVGQYIEAPYGERLEIVGVVQGAAYRTLQEPPRPMVYHPITREYVARQHAIVRTPPGIEPPVAALRAAIGRAASLRAIDPLAAQLSGALALDWLTTAVVGVSAAFALLLAMMGVYGVMNDAVRQRRREIGLRMALGARPLEIGRFVVTHALGLAAAGLATGLVLQLALGAIVRTRVAIAGFDAATLAATLGALTLVVGIAAVVPIRRALGVHPAVTLRSL